MCPTLALFNDNNLQPNTWSFGGVIRSNIDLSRKMVLVINTRIVFLILILIYRDSLEKTVDC